jgi:multidrug transporter EmrE-like cation transporter
MIFVTYTISFVLFTATLPLWPLSIAYGVINHGRFVLSSYSLPAKATV